MSAAGRGTFDRVRPRVPAGDEVVAPSAHDNEGKRALFSAAGPEASDRPATGAVTFDCARCEARTVLGPAAALRTALPSMVLSLGIGRGARESTLGLSRRRYGAFLRCPACGRGSWTRITIRL